MRKSVILFVSVVAIVACLSQLWRREPEFLLEDGAPGVGETVVLGNRAPWLVVESSLVENPTLEGRRLSRVGHWSLGVGDWVGHFDEEVGFPYSVRTSPDGDEAIADYWVYGTDVSFVCEVTVEFESERVTSLRVDRRNQISNPKSPLIFALGEEPPAMVPGFWVTRQRPDAPHP